MRCLPKPLQHTLGFGDDRLVSLLLAKGDKLDIIVELAGEARESRKGCLKLLPLAHQSPRASGVVPEVGSFGLAVERG